nr:TniB family NTP-binding protein [Martelella sp. HB161492]
MRFLSNRLQILLVCFGVNDAREAISGDVQLARRFRQLTLSRWAANEQFETLGTRDRYQSCEANRWDGASHVLCCDQLRAENGRELPSPFPQNRVAAPRAGVAIVERAGPDMLRMLRGCMMGDNRARFSSATENMIARANKLRAYGKMQRI